MVFMEQIRSGMLNMYYRIKGMGVFALIPLLILYLIIPAINYSAFWYFRDMDMLYFNIVTTSQYLIPIVSVWYVLFILYHFVEQTGNEILYVFSMDKLTDLFFPYLFFSILMLPLFLVYTKLFPELWFFYGALLAVNFAYLAFSYFTAFLNNSISISVIGILCYTIFEIMIKRNLDDVYIYQEAAHHIGNYMRSCIVPYIAVAVVMLLLGRIIQKKGINRNKLYK